ATIFDETISVKCFAVRYCLKDLRIAAWIRNTSPTQSLRSASGLYSRRISVLTSVISDEELNGKTFAERFNILVLVISTSLQVLARSSERTAPWISIASSNFRRN